MDDNLAALVNREKSRIRSLRKAIEIFCSSTRHAITADSDLILGSLFGEYKRMEPCIHRQASKPGIIDLDAFSYAMQRLPEEIANAEEFFVGAKAENLDSVSGIRKLSVKGDKRRRTMYEKGSGYIHMIAREGETDVFDALSLLIMYGIEAQKMRNILADSRLEDEIKRMTEVDDSSEKNQVMGRVADVFGVSYPQLRGVDFSLDHRLFNIIANSLMHRPEELLVRFDEYFKESDAAEKVEAWCDRLEKELAVYDGRPLILISSDTHSVVNCLTGFAKENKDAIIEFAGESEMMDDPSWLYHMARKFYKVDEGFLQEKKDYESSLGIRFVRDEFHTGIDVQIIDTAKLDIDKIDPRIRVRKKRNEAPVIVNIDYAFGKEGKYIMTELCDALGKRIDSISIAGKAGIVSGQRYDIMLPTYVIPQIEGGIYQFPRGKNMLRPEHFSGMGFFGQVFSDGPMLTVPGTAIQNDLVMFDYMVRYGILGLEMEGAPYVDAIEKAYVRGILRKKIGINVGYWGSDEPLAVGKSLAESHMDEGYKSSYALIIAILNNVLNHKDQMR